MTTTVQSTNNIGPGVTYNAAAVGDIWMVLQGVTFMNTTGVAAGINFADSAIYNAGNVFSGASYSVFVTNGAGTDIVNAATGTIATFAATSGQVAAYLAGNNGTLQNQGEIISTNGGGATLVGTGNVATNAGRIFGGEVGLLVSGSVYSVSNSGTIESGSLSSAVAVYLSGVGFEQHLFNSGTIQSLGPTSGTGVFVAVSGQVQIDNSGTILSTGGIAIDASTSTGSLQLSNSGLIASSAAVGYSIVGSAQADTIINSGEIQFAVFMGAGDDLFDGTGGHVGGQILGGGDNDTYIVSDSLAQVFEYAAEGVDAVLSSVNFNLANTGEVELLALLGTAVLGIGNVYDNLIDGNDVANVLTGAAGQDTLNGGQGNDSLRGDLGNDYLRGEDDNDLLRGGSGTDTLYGGEGDDTLWGDVSNDRLYGDNGEDVLVGGVGRDTLYGGAEGDTFVFRAVADSGPGALRDLIAAFETGLDLIDLTRVDASTLVTGNQAFNFIGTGAFTSVAGQLRAIHGANSILQADVNGDSIADFELQLNGIATVNVNDILL